MKIFWATAMILILSVSAAAQQPTSVPLELARGFDGGNRDWVPVIDTFDGVEMALVPVGCFTTSWDQHTSHTLPGSRICIDEPFWIDRYEVTNALYGSPGRISGDDHPRDTVTWSEAQAFCERRGGRLPTEAEWEFAARGPDNLAYPWGHEFNADAVVYAGNSGGTSASVGSRPGDMSWVGAHDMSGSLWEWVGAGYGLHPVYTPADATAPAAPTITPVVALRVLRGGSWSSGETSLRADTRLQFGGDFGDVTIGFRCARSTAPGSDQQTAAPHDMGFLEVDIDYDDSFYHEVFDYSRTAENIRHYVLIVPESEAANIDPDWVFTSLAFPSYPGELAAAPGREAYAEAFIYLHEAPEGRLVQALAPGRYVVAVAFIAAALSREEAGVDEDVILYAGVTGGGASTDFREVIIEPGKTNALRFALTDRDGWACPWLYVYDGEDFIRTTEILRNLRGHDSERVEITAIDGIHVIDGTITVRITEEKDEVSFIDTLYILVDGAIIRPHAGTTGTAARSAAAKVAARDQDYLVIAPGESVVFRFTLPGTLASAERAAVQIVTSGYYEPLEP